MRRNRLGIVLVGIVGGLGCGPKSGPPAPGGEASRPAPAAAPVPAPPVVAPLEPPTGVRLPRDLSVERYDLQLTLDPSKPTMTGSVTITGALAKPTAVIWLHAEEITFGSAKATAGGHEVPLEVVTGLARGRVALRAATPLPAGPATVAIDYTARVPDDDDDGTYRYQVGDDWYAFTQHEAIAARRSVPCVDEPDLKVPWRLRLTVPAGSSAVGNAPIESDVVDGAVRHVQFAPTERIPSYLLAYAVGPFEYVDAGKTSTGAPIRIVTLRGRAADAAFAAASTPKIVAELERWFGTPYPYAKLDSIADPVKRGAMENPGLITYDERLILIPAGAAETRRERYASIAAHELAHQWFGNLVTPVWWDDLWLNESFASWLPEKVIKVLYPAWVAPDHVAAARNQALEADSLVTARRIRQPIASEDDIYGAFDGITYGKGAAVLRMLEAWVGPERFQAGVRAYLAEHAWGNATAADFVGAIAAQAPDRQVAAAFGGLLDQAGAPRVTVATECPKGGQARLTLTPDRFLPLGARGGDDPRWHLPVCVRAGVGGKAVTTCTELAGGAATVELAACPAWVWPNADGRGYYRSALDAAGWRAVRTRGWKQLSAAERLAAAQDLAAAVGAGAAGVDVALELVPALIAERSPAMVGLAVQIVGGVRPWIPAERQDAFARWVHTQFGPLARKLGWTPRAGDGIDVERLRGSVVPLVADLGRDPALRKTAVAQARTWRTAPDAVRADLLWVAVRAEPALHDDLVAAFRTEPDRIARGELARAIGQVTDAARLQAALALTLDPAIELRVAMAIVRAALDRPDTRPVAEAFVVANLDALIARAPRDTSAGLSSWLATSCDATRLAEMRVLAEDKLGSQRGARRAIDQRFEAADQCVARRAAAEPVLAAWLAKLR
ncbi:MAG TPA: M1 family metallopeptidase [Kofleriaceae bacterium]|nr:M1 family metallopeptidase [Kofleriaceae bacterium]